MSLKLAFFTDDVTGYVNVLAVLYCHLKQSHIILVILFQVNKPGMKPNSKRIVLLIYWIYWHR